MRPRAKSMNDKTVSKSMRLYRVKVALGGGVFIRWNGTVEWNGGMEQWNGIVEWNGGLVE